MKSTKVLVQVNCAFDFYMCTALLVDKENLISIDLLAADHVLCKLPSDLLAYYDRKMSYSPRIKNLISLKSLLETWRLKHWARRVKAEYSIVLFGAYRNEITSVLAGEFKGSSKLVAIKQGIDMPDDFYHPYRSIVGLHDAIYYSLLGFSPFIRERRIQSKIDPKRSDYWFSRLRWRNDPFQSENVFTIGRPIGKYTDGRNYVLPDFSHLLNFSRKYEKQGILIIGERTPMTPSWGRDQDLIVAEIFSKILELVVGERIYLRGRKNLTNNSFYSSLKPIYLDPDQLYDDQLLKLNPRLVISVKSTASKVAAYYGFQSIFLYPLMKFQEEEVQHLDYLFGDGAPVVHIQTIECLELFFSDECKEKVSLDLGEAVSPLSFINSIQ